MSEPSTEVKQGVVPAGAAATVSEKKKHNDPFCQQ